MGKYKDELLKEHSSSPFKAGDYVKVPLKNFRITYYDDGKKANGEITEVVSDHEYKVKLTSNSSIPGTFGNGTYAVVEAKDIEKDDFMVGHNPFKNIGFWSKCERLSYDIEGILIACGISNGEDEYGKDSKYVVGGYNVPELNFDPYITDKDGKKVYYQRDFVWTEEEERSFIDSIYNGVNCGTIVIRKRPWKYVEEKAKAHDTDGLAFNDVVDGKQRLHTLQRFVNDEFADSYGRYYSDLSKKSKVLFKRSDCLNVLRLREESTDEDVVKSFVMINHAGKPMPKEHLDFVRSIRI